MTTHRKNQIPMIATILLIVATLAIGPVASAGATPQSTIETPSTDQNVATLIAQLECMLGSHNVTTRQKAMQDVIGLANRPHHKPEHVQWTAGQVLPEPADFRPLVPALLAAYASEPDHRTRTLAAVALHAVGDEAGMEQLWTLADRESSPVLQNRMNRLLGDYFARAYPELKGDSQITKAKVKRAQRRAEAERLIVEAY